MLRVSTLSILMMIVTTEACQTKTPAPSIQSAVEQLRDAAYDLGRIDQHSIDCMLLEREERLAYTRYRELVNARERNETINELFVGYAIERHMQAASALMVIATGEHTHTIATSLTDMSLCELLTWKGRP